MTTPRSYAILGAGPAGATLAILLARQGHRVVVFHTPKRPALIVGESLLPAVIPMIRELGLEEEIKSFSTYKPGATVCLSLADVIPAKFEWTKCPLPPYAYNCPRDRFDQTLMMAAENAGATLIHHHAELERGETPGSVRLAPSSLEVVREHLNGSPDWVIDATGRNRAISRLLELPIQRGGREDIALFAHLDRAYIHDAGHVHLDHLTHGWAWRIPLPGRVSVGFVIQPDHLKNFGSNAQEQYDNYLRSEKVLASHTQGSTRLTPVVKYQNYQIISDQMHGPGWASIGDAAGFLDPVFSTGLYLGMKSAFQLDKALQKNTPAALDQYQNHHLWELRMWKGVIDSWYDGKLFNLYRAGQRFNTNFVGRMVEKRFRRRIARVLAGYAVNELGRMRLFGNLMHFGTVMRDPQDLAIR